ncbi:PKD domain-containing protein [Prolixibacteraceae bacterium Z1-6]|uniref:PKD domain-containing protein n=1 Tax=Draconibacterium aestuarii TaxID=2998507 RepID=A0A9X3FFT3_9BACT|nr:PKD domain-containing protein [Prolixibacteraceae bacterium Z1-6]
MKKSEHLVVLLITMYIGITAAFGQNSNKAFKMEGKPTQTIEINLPLSETTEITPFENNVNKIYGLAASAEIILNSSSSKVSIILTDQNFEEYLIYESYELAEQSNSVTIDTLCEETWYLDDVKVHSIRIEISDEASVLLKSLSYTTRSELKGDYAKLKKERKQVQNAYKIEQINKNIKVKGKHWVAGPTSVSELSYADKKKLYGQSTFPPGFEYYAGGVISTESSDESSTLKSATATSPYIDNWDWRDRHGKNWISPVTNQGACGSCWAFASTGATEAMVNLFFNQQLNLNLAEQDVLSCSGAGDCSGGYPSIALNYITNKGVVDEVAFPYEASDISCNNKSNNPAELIQIAGKVDFGSVTYPKTEDDLKRMLIEMGPVSGGLYSWSHALVLVGYKVVKEGDIFYYQDPNTNWSWVTIASGDPLIEKTVWIFKNSWGANFGDKGYVYVESDITNFGWTHALKTPIASKINNYNVICEDDDGDGYYWWGLGSKPTTCTGPDQPDGNDSDPTLGPLDEYGYCVELQNSPSANFSSDNTSIIQNESISFSDLSSSNVSSWSWVFEGGYPSTSSERNPQVTYSMSGTYNVSLTVTNAYGSDTKIVSDYISVDKVYCNSHGDATDEWINIVQLGIPIGSQSSGTSGYKDMTNVYTFQATGGTNENIYLVPGFNGNEFQEYWKVWIDFNGDLDFDDDGELVLNSSLTQGMASGMITFPPNLNLVTRMRISMNRDNSPSPCEIFSFGEVKDYLIEIKSPEIQMPVANFTSDISKITIGESVTYSNLSLDATSWSWTFEGGTPENSTELNPTITYNTSGTYNVTLIAANADGTNTKTAVEYIQVLEPAVIPVADFSASPRVVLEGETVSFSDLSANTPTSWEWTFEGADPGTSTEQNPTITYTTAGSYLVTLVATNAAGSQSISKANYIEVTEPVLFPEAAFSADTRNIKAGDTVSFTDLTSNDPISWNWTFEGADETYSSVQNPSVTYSTPGLYSVILMATNNFGSDTISINDYIEVSEPDITPIADFDANNTLISEGQEVAFNDKSQNNPKTWNWEFEGGTPSTSNLKNPMVKYNLTNNYRVTLVVTNDAGEDIKIVDNYIQVQAPDPAYCTPTAIASSEWIAGVYIDGQANTTSASGYADLTSFAFEMESGTSHNIELTPGFNSRSKFEYWAVWIDFNEDMAFSDNEKVFSSSKSKSTVSGSIDIPAELNITTRMRVVMSPTIPTSACDNITGEVEDYTVLLVEPALKADFTASSTTVSVGETIQFTNTSMYNPTIVKWTFTGGDIDESFADNPTVTYNTVGEQTVTLLVSNELGSDEKTITISVVDGNTTIYCTPINISALVNYIRRMVFAGSEVNSGANEYSLSDIAFDNIDAGQVYPVELSPWSVTTRNFWRIWIDFNKDGIFDDATETVLALNNKKGTVTGDIVIPIEVSGTTRMRVAMKVGSAPLSCEDNFVGEVEDYSITINEALPQMKASVSNPLDEIGTQPEIRVYPNPTSDFITINLDVVKLEDTYTLFNLSGSMLIQNQITSSNTQVDLSDYPSGVYLIRVKNSEQILNKKIIKKD